MKAFRQITLPLLELPNKEGSTALGRISVLVKDVCKLDFSNFYHLCTDGGGEVTGGKREHGDGGTGLFSLGFKEFKSTWTWCNKHLLSLAFDDSDLTQVYENLNKVSKFLRCANRWKRLKPHIELIIKYMQDPDVLENTVDRNDPDRYGV